MVIQRENRRSIVFSVQRLLRSECARGDELINSSGFASLSRFGPIRPILVRSDVGFVIGKIPQPTEPVANLPERILYQTLLYFYIRWGARMAQW